MYLNMRLKKRLSRLFKKENKFLHKDILDIKHFLQLLAEDEKHARKGDLLALFSHRH